MTSSLSDGMNRVAKIEIDAGRATSVEDAHRRLRTYVLQIDVGEPIKTANSQACLLTAVNVASRAFLGGVHVRLSRECTVALPWFRGWLLSDAITALGGALVDSFDPSHATILLGDAPRGNSEFALFATWDAWAAGVTDRPDDKLSESREFVLSGTLAGALAVSEAFQILMGNVVAGRRSLGLSLWRPDVDWRLPDAAGIPLKFLPSRVWLLGLGHIGQALAWSLGLLPYEDLGTAEIWLQDVDYVVPANWSTSALTQGTDISKRKTRVVDARLAQVGFKTTIVERLFDENQRRRPDEPGLALSGFDKPEPRRALGSVHFDAIVDAGLGSGSAHFDDLLIHSFPSGLEPQTAWPHDRASAPNFDLTAPAYVHEAERMRKEGLSPDQTQCGLVELAGRTAAAPFVGAATSALVLAEVLRTIADGPRFEVVALSLRTPQHRTIALNTAPGAVGLPFVRANPPIGW